jgi:hypothetical protein
VARIIGVAFLLLLQTGRALAWGDEGHKVIALIAVRYLRPEVLAKVNAMLAADGANDLTAHDIAAEATWADKFRGSSQEARAQTRQWHFVDIELADPDEAAACFGRPALGAGKPAYPGLARDCVVDKIEEFRAELADRATSPSERLLALKFLLHFMGDLHQPLHSSDDQDRGGNEKLLAKAASNSRNLHAFWDTAAVTVLGTNPTAVASELIARVTAAQEASWAGGTAANWAQETFAIAKADAYGQLPPPKFDGKYELRSSYRIMAGHDAALQLSKAGVRLAFVLNQAMASQP